MKTETFLFDGVEYEIKIGKCREENDALVRSSLPTDMWFHLANVPSCHVVVTSADNRELSKELPKVLKELPKVTAHGADNRQFLKELPKQVIKRCACLCIAHSKPTSKKNIPVSYTPIANLINTSVLGQVQIVGQCKTIII